MLRHYEDLSADLAGEMRQLARHLNIIVPEDRWPSLVQAATFKQMRAAADQIRPLAAPTSGKLNQQHAAFRRGTSGDGQMLLTRAEINRYHARAGRIASQDLLTWLHRDPAAD